VGPRSSSALLVVFARDPAHLIISRSVSLTRNEQVSGSSPLVGSLFLALI
jgi:hypothetical protein